MGAIAFDTYLFIKKLEASGFEEKQAEALSEVIKEVQEAQLEKLATKQDILELKRDIKELELAARRDIKELELKFNGQFILLKWMLGFIFAGIVSLVLKAFLAH